MSISWNITMVVVYLSNKIRIKSKKRKVNGHIPFLISIQSHFVDNLGWIEPL